jgi:hypothetical protein
MKAYYPKSQIQTNLYSNGEYQLVSTKIPYIGNYWKTSKGEYYTGTGPQYAPVEELEPVQTNSNSSLDRTTNVEINPAFRNLPPSIIPFPTEEDYKAGVFFRHFYRRINQPIFTEITKEDFDKLVQKNSQYLWQVTNPFKIPWTLIGEESYVQTTNQNVILTIQQREPVNLRGLVEYFNGKYLKFYRK